MRERRAHGAFADNENADGMRRDFILAEKVGHKGEVAM